MEKMTEQEAAELDDLLTRTDPELGPNGTGFLNTGVLAGGRFRARLLVRRG